MTNSQWILLLILILALYLLRSTKEDEDRPPIPPTRAWNQLHFDFNHSEEVQAWQSAGYDYLTTEKWIKIGIKPRELALVQWIKEVKGLSPEYLLNRWGNVNPLRDEWERKDVPAGSGIKFYH